MFLFVDTDYLGHHSEYLKIIIKNCIDHNICACFYVHPLFLNDLRESERSNDLVFYTSKVHEESSNAFKEMIFINGIIKKHHVSRCLLLNVNMYLKILPFIKISECKVSGIYFMPFLRKQKLGVIERVIKTILFKALLVKPMMSQVFVLNDKRIVENLNKYFSTDKFFYMVDPVYVNCKNLISQRRENKKKIRFAFIGEVSERKGIYQLLKVIDNLNEDIRNRISITIAGNASKKKELVAQMISEIQVKYYGLIEEVVLDRISDEHFEEILANTDVVLCLHQILEGSSGVIGKAAAFNKIIIGPKKGLIGELMSDYKLGIQVNTSDVNEICQGFKYIVSKNAAVPKGRVKEYVMERTPLKFFHALTEESFQ